MEKKKFQLPEINVIKCDEVEIITASNPFNTNGTYDDGKMNEYFDLNLGN